MKTTVSKGTDMAKGYSRAQISLHWAVALLIFYQLFMGDGMSEVWRGFRNSGTTTMTTAAWLHIIAGVLILAFALWRLALRFTRGVPEAPDGTGTAMRLAGEAGHWALYVLMLAMPITGLLAWYGGMTNLAGLHGELLKLLTIVMILLHILAALFHQFVVKDHLIARMMRSRD
jgi:cytochrome b561